MGINPSVLFPGKINAPDANYTYGSARNVTVSGDGTGTPWLNSIPNDLWGFVQKLLIEAKIVPSGNPDTVLASDYYNSLLRLINRSYDFTDSGVADAYVLTSDTLINPLTTYEVGRIYHFIPSATNTGPSTVDIDTLGVVSILDESGSALTGGEIKSGVRLGMMYQGSGAFWLMSWVVETTGILTSVFHSISTSEVVPIGAQKAVFVVTGGGGGGGDGGAPGPGNGTNSSVVGSNVNIVSTGGLAGNVSPLFTHSGGSVSGTNVISSVIKTGAGSNGGPSANSSWVATTGNAGQVIAFANVVAGESLTITIGAGGSGGGSYTTSGKGIDGFVEIYYY